jgi:pilus assembly protein Flp/PilA
MKIIRLFHSLVRSQEGVTAIEYGLLAGLIAVVIIGGVTAVRIEVVAIYELISTTVMDAIN